MSQVRGVDTDNYDGPVSVERFKNLHDNHAVVFNIVGCQIGSDGANYTEIQTTNSRAAGIFVPFHYEFLYWTDKDSDLERLKRAAGFGLPVLVDCETEKVGWIPDQFVERIHEGKDALISEGQYGGIYTGGWWWPSHTRNCTDFSTDYLWAANYVFKEGTIPPENFVVDLSTFASFGGWSVPTIWQYSDQCYDEPTFDMSFAEEIIVKDGWVKEGHAWTLYNEGTPIERRGSIDGSGTPGQISKNFGGTWYYLVHGESPDGGHTSPAIFSDTSGD